MVRREYDEHFAVLDLREYERQKVGQIAVEPVIHVLRLDRFGTVGFADAARRIETDVQQVGRAVGAELELGDGLLGEAEYGGVARRGVEHPVEIGGELQAAAARLVLLLFVLAREDYVPVAGVDVAALFVERPPFGGDVREVVAFAVAARHPFGNVGGVVGRGGPAAARRVEPEDLAAASAQDDRRRGFGRHGDGLAAGFVLQERFGERRQRHGRGGLLVVVTAVGEDRAAVDQAPESSFAVIVGVTREILGAHRADDDINDQPGPCGRDFEGREGSYGE